MKYVIFLSLMIASQTIVGCSEKIIETNVGVVILLRDGQARKSDVYKLGPRCWVAWYKGIEKVLLKSNGTADDVVFHYRWTLDRMGPDDIMADQQWFKSNCVEP